MLSLSLSYLRPTMNDNNFSPALLDQLSSALMAHMSSKGPLVQQQPEATAECKSLQTLSQALLQQLQSPTPHAQSQSPITPRPNGQDLERTSSLSSITSVSSLCSAASKQDRDNDDDGNSGGMKKKRRRNKDDDREYLNIVRLPILGQLDSTFLAPHPLLDNPMFRDRTRRAGQVYLMNSKTAKFIYMPFFKQTTGALVRTLTHNNLARLQAHEPTLTYAILQRRLHCAAVKVTKKRRANHVQSWRPDINNTHKPLIYGVVGPLPDPNPPNIDNGSRHAPIQQAPQNVAPSQRPQMPNRVPSQQPQMPNLAPSHQPQMPNLALSQRPQMPNLAPSQQPQMPNRVPSQQQQMRMSVGAIPSCRPVDFPETMQCVEPNCRATLTKDNAYPKDETGEWGDNPPQPRCQQCYEKLSQSMLGAIEREDVRDKKERELQKRKRDQSAGVSSGEPPSKKNKNKEKQQCKWCGSKRHRTNRSKHCPHHDEFLAAKAAKAANKAAPEPEHEPANAPEPEREPDNAPEPKADSVSDSDVDADAETEDEDSQFDPLAASGSPPASTSPPASVSPPAPTPKPPVEVGDNVFVSYGKDTYFAQLFKVDGDKYHVYFPDGDGEEDVVTAGVLTKEEKSRRREDYLQLEFYSKDFGLPPGRWKIAQEVENNNFSCVRLSGDGEIGATEEFDISYAMKQVREDEEYRRERGPTCKGRF